MLEKKEWVSFSEMKNALKISDGNLSSHLKGLHDHRYIKLKRKFVAGRPSTLYAFSAKGKKAFSLHKETLIGLLTQD